MEFLKGWRGLGASALVILALAFPVSAAAQDDCSGPTGDQYCPATQVLTAGGSGEDPQDPSSAAGGLPFTGFDLALSVIAGVGLLGAGLALRRTSPGRNAAR